MEGEEEEEGLNIFLSRQTLSQVSGQTFSNLHLTTRSQVRVTHSLTHSLAKRIDAGRKDNKNVRLDS